MNDDQKFEKILHAVSLSHTEDCLRYLLIWFRIVLDVNTHITDFYHLSIFSFFLLLHFICGTSDPVPMLLIPISRPHLVIPRLNLVSPLRARSPQ